MVLEGVYWIQLAEDRLQWHASMNIVRDLRLSGDDVDL
jgi:hypothetical protein